ncbi:FAD-binding oxidoreductase [Streptomyces glomeratus]|uniref:FAD-binding oxidoreductase n=1 Tax=Streptomyces glomeratus TaxID=284452 RepID=A0ABP6LPX2_9ACTN|nr:FAD-binding oxidoreductase [Streptomyces glomeratus]MCF1509795.1 FAD-binding oxidoreductase [Streptomyces glomeratus]
MTGARRRKFWGWGYEDEQPGRTEAHKTADLVRSVLGFGAEHVRTPPAVADLDLPAPRLAIPGSLAPVMTTDPYQRASHAYGKSYRDVVRGFHGEFPHPPDLVAFPRDENDITAVLDWCQEAGAAVIPYGGGTSVVGGVEPLVDDRYAGTVTLDLGRLDRVLDVDTVSGAALIQAGAALPHADAQLRPHGLTLRHYPQSYELATVGGSVVTRAGGHYATGRTHLDDFVQSLRAVTPAGLWESRRVPASGAGPSPDRMLIGSEGVLGVVTQAWLRVQERPRFRASAALSHATFADGTRAARDIVRSGLQPANCRLLDPGEARLNGAGDGRSALLILGFESAHAGQEALLAQALECARRYGGTPLGDPRISGPDPTDDAESPAPTRPEGQWKDSFQQAPHLRDVMVAADILVETFETAVTWDRFEEFDQRVHRAAEQAAARVCVTATVHRRLTHVYPDGAAVYYTVLAPARRGSEIAQWDDIKAAVSDVIMDAGGTITHHHAVGRDHRPWYDRQRPPLFARALRAAKRELDPHGVLNPGVLIG